MKFFLLLVIIMFIINGGLICKRAVNEKSVRQWWNVAVAILTILLITSIANKAMYYKECKVDISSTNISTLNLKQDLVNIKHKFNIKDELQIQRLNIGYADNGEISKVDVILLGEKYKKRVLYKIEYNNKTNGKYDMFMRENDVFEDTNIDCDFVVEKIDVIKNEKPNREFDKYEISVNGITEFQREDLNVIYVDKNNNMKKVTKEQLPVEGIWITLGGTESDGYAVNQYSPTQSAMGNIEFIIETNN